MSLAVPHPDLSRRGPTGTAASVRGPVVSTNKHAERTRPTSRRQHHRSTSGAQDMLSTAAAAASAAPPPLASAAAGAQQSLLSVLATTWLSTERRRSAQRRELACKARVPRPWRRHHVAAARQSVARVQQAEVERHTHVGGALLLSTEPRLNEHLIASRRADLRTTTRMTTCVCACQDRLAAGSGFIPA